MVEEFINFVLTNDEYKSLMAEKLKNFESVTFQERIDVINNSFESLGKLQLTYTLSYLHYT